jgi:uncharacterized membrane protein
MGGGTAISGQLLQRLLLAAVLVYGTALRSWELGASPLWADEAESSINALTILQHGVPVGSYLGVPIFENTLTRFWPENQEYEFRDTSYSDRGLAVYHGWLPFYAIAASFAAYGITPDEPSSSFAVRHSPEEMHRRTVAARLPSVVFGLVFLVGVFLAGRELYGLDAACAALVAGAVSTTTITLARQARYYSLTLALSAMCALMVARLMNRGARRDFVLSGVVFALLFHANILAFVGAGAAFALLIPFLVRRDRIVGNLACFGGIVTAGILPWVLAAGFLGAAFDRPMARELLAWSDIADYALDRVVFVVIAAATLVWVFATWRPSKRISQRFTVAFAHGRSGFVFLAAWASVAFVAFIVLIPAASYFYSRLTLVILVPALLFGAMLAAAIGRTVMPRHSVLVGTPLLILLLYSGGKTTFWWPHFLPGQPQIFAVIDHLRGLDIPAGTRLYADAGVGLPLMFYSGLPFRNVLPVRRSFLDSYPDELLIVEGPRVESLSWVDVTERFREQGTVVVAADARRIARRFSEQAARERVESRVARTYPVASPALELTVLAPVERRKTTAGVQRMIEESGNPMFRGFEIRDYAELWQVFFYRFVGPHERMGEKLNYAGRIRHARAFVLPEGWVVIRCPRL